MKKRLIAWYVITVPIIVATVLYASQVKADSSGIALQLPNTGGTYGQDEIRTPEGLDCKNAIGGSTNLEFGVTGIIDNYQSPFGGGNNFGDTSRDIGIYARIVIPLDKPKERINCNSLYELELRKKRLEVLKLQEEIDALKKLNASGKSNFEN
jgi:hypothetical protein